MSATLPGPDGRLRCRWCVAMPQYLAYHDHEWGFPVADDRRLFEKLSLEAFQAGLSWRTILAKRDNFRAAAATPEAVFQTWADPEAGRCWSNCHAEHTAAHAARP